MKNFLQHIGNNLFFDYCFSRPFTVQHSSDEFSRYGRIKAKLLQFFRCHMPFILFIYENKEENKK